MSNQRLCECGDCESAMNRAMKICEQMYSDNECANFQLGVAMALRTLASSGIYRTFYAQDPVLFTIIGEEVVRMEENACAGMINDHAKSRHDELTKRLGGAYDGMVGRLKADYEAIKNDKPEIKKA